MPIEAGATKVDLSQQAQLRSGQLSPSFQLVRNITEAVRNTGKLPDWFGPGTPLTPTMPLVLAGRMFDYPVATNTVNQPKVGEGVPFQLLRDFSRACTMLRLVIETRKDTLCKLEWAIVPKDKKAKADARCEQLQQFFAKPDKELSWATWLRAILEDLLVLDAAALWPQKARDGSLYAVQLINGATIKRVIDDYGRTPAPPYPAYQQYLKGLPATDYTREELVYNRRNVSTDRIYGYSPVEQVISFVELALNRQIYQKAYYESGSTADLILSVPETWTPEQIATFKTWWDSILKGNPDRRRGTMFVHNGTSVINTKEAILSDKFDEWLARVICFCFGMSPAPFIQMMNRATSEQADTTAKEEGIGPFKDWIRDLMNGILAEHCGAPDLKFTFLDEEQVSQEQRAKTQDMKLRNGSLTINEAREEDGRDPVEGGDTPLIFGQAAPLERVLEPPEPAPMPGAPSGAGGPGSAPPKKKAPDGAPVKKAVDKEALLKRVLSDVLGKLADSIAEQTGVLGELEKAKNPLSTRSPLKSVNPLAQAILDAIDMAVLTGAKPAIENVLVAEAAAASTAAAAELGVDSLFELTPAIATEFAAQRAAELVGTAPGGGILGDSTRLLIRSTIVKAMDEGWTVQALKDALRADYAFSAERAALIAENEMRIAINEGELRTWTASGVVKGKVWLLSNDEGICDICEGNAKQKIVLLNTTFQSGHKSPPAHPRCRCSMAPITKLVPVQE